MRKTLLKASMCSVINLIQEFLQLNCYVEKWGLNLMIFQIHNRRISFLQENTQICFALSKYEWFGTSAIHKSISIFEIVCTKNLTWAYTLANVFHGIRKFISKLLQANRVVVAHHLHAGGDSRFKSWWRWFPSICLRLF